mmetsp:Transcript_4775/g.4270  ORF Transcript_4775/g.4270 Transcript_4775/m.4270 type:complete len:84 (-) Transcript_4775:31-282(-)
MPRFINLTKQEFRVAKFSRNIKEAKAQLELDAYIESLGANNGDDDQVPESVTDALEKALTERRSNALKSSIKHQLKTFLKPTK